MKQLRLVLGDQLNHDHSWFAQADDSVTYLLAEIRSETDYVRHHIQKVCAIFQAMEKFAARLESEGHNVIHLTLDDTEDDPDFPTLITRMARDTGADEFHYQRPDEYRLLQALRNLDADVSVTEHDTEHFIVPFEDLASRLPTSKNTRMETFYRKLRKEHDVLMDDGEPVGGKWNYDASNRSKLKAADLEDVPQPLLFENDVTAICRRLQQHKVDTLGEVGDTLSWPTDRKQSLALLDHFCSTCLEQFGTFQDAMTDQVETAWTLYHSRLSCAINLKLLHPLEVIQAAVQAFESNKKISIEQVEGFVRQILGWREYIRGVYWTRMPDYRELNSLKADRDLPDFFWTGDTQMNCLHQAIKQSLQHGYAHHIQRLMVTGNFCLLTGIDPDQVDNWYLGIYVDAFEWVELPNTRGMSQFADGGIVGSKAYAASGNYITKQSDYCKNCRYDVRQKTGSDACPLNSLYWHFMVRHRDSMESNPRIGMVYRNWDKQDKDSRSLVLEHAEQCLADLSTL